MRLPDFAIIGAMKCGTSTLHEQLALRSGFFMSRPKEPNFFSDDDQYARGVGWYAGLFAGAAPGQLCGESSTHYTKLPTYP
ncbi:MAG TPA: sulfotransferase, partial [Myxococcota bacterium]|nr:sulfotransferase [Myxococcota bacterium]